jgi:hypothetical protein
VRRLATGKIDGSSQPSSSLVRHLRFRASALVNTDHGTRVLAPSPDTSRCAGAHGHDRMTEIDALQFATDSEFCHPRPPRLRHLELRRVDRCRRDSRLGAHQRMLAKVRLCLLCPRERRNSRHCTRSRSDQERTRTTTWPLRIASLLGFRRGRHRHRASTERVCHNIQPPCPYRLPIWPPGRLHRNRECVPAYPSTRFRIR